MISYDEFLVRQGYKPERQTAYRRCFERLRENCPGKTVFVTDDLRQFAKGHEGGRFKSELAVVEKYLRLTFQLKESQQSPVTPGEAKAERRPMTPRQAVDYFLEYLKRREYRPATVEGYGYDLACWLRYVASIGIDDVHEVGRSDMNGYKEYLFRVPFSDDRRYGVNQQRSRLRRVRQLFALLCRDGLVASNPCRGMKLPRREYRLSRSVLTYNELENFFATIDTSSVCGFVDRTLYELLYATGIRIHELLNLRVADTDPAQRLVTVRGGKGDRDRVCPLTVIAARYLATYLDHVRPQWRPESEYLFPGESGGRAQKPVLNHRLQQYRRKAGIEHQVGFHTFRRTFATHLIKEGVDLRLVQQLLGHRSLSSTMDYVVVTIADLYEVVTRCHPREQALATANIQFQGADHERSKDAERAVS